MKLIRRSLIVSIAAFVVLGFFSPAHARAAVSPPDDAGLATCPELTDSVVRLYSAYFLREPDAGGFNYWLDIYSGPQAGLKTISDVFAASTEFTNTYGALGDAAFVELVYSNVLGRAPEASGLAHWTNALGTGFSRGELMISFSESEEYVTLSGTAAPMAGYLSWYDNSVQFDCGQGPETVPLTGLASTPYLDVILLNPTAGPVGVDWILTDANGSFGEPEVLDGGLYAIYWNYDLVSPIPTQVEFTTDGPVASFFWAYVTYDHPHSATRAPYTDQP